MHVATKMREAHRQGAQHEAGATGAVQQHPPTCEELGGEIGRPAGVHARENVLELGQNRLRGIE
jgi:hypothetical protein